jgi:hypothetical protein
VQPKAARTVTVAVVTLVIELRQSCLNVLCPSGSEAASVRQTIFNSNFPETLFSFGVAASYVFPSDPKVMATRVLMAFTNVQLLSYADR